MALRRVREHPRQLSVRVEIDGTCLRGGKTGCGSPNKAPSSLPCRRRRAGTACLTPHPFTNESMLEFAERSLAGPRRWSSTACRASVQ
jgi:hypothetical protein